MDNTFQDFLQYLHEQDRSQATIRAYASDLRAFRIWFETANNEPLMVERVTAVDMREYRRHLAVQGKTPATINRRLAAIRAWLQWAQRRGLIQWVPEARGVRKQTLAPRWLSKREEAALLRTAERAKQRSSNDLVAHFLAVRDWAIVTLLLHTGLRVSELAALRLEDVTLRPRSGWLLVHGKGRKQRQVPLNRIARRALREWLEMRNARVPEGSNPYVFVGQKWVRRKPMAPSTVWRIFRGIAREAGVEASPHALRHTLAKRLVDSGVSLEKLAAILGHESLDTTRQYIEPGKADLQQAVETLE